MASTAMRGGRSSISRKRRSARKSAGASPKRITTTARAGDRVGGCQAGRERARGDPPEARPAGRKSPLFPRKAGAAAEAVAARAGAHRASRLAIFLSAEADQDDERRLRDLLSLRDRAPPP